MQLFTALNGKNWRKTVNFGIFDGSRTRAMQCELSKQLKVKMSIGLTQRVKPYVGAN
jgi:hypothetical protein